MYRPCSYIPARSISTCTKHIHIRTPVPSSIPLLRSVILRVARRITGRERKKEPSSSFCCFPRLTLSAPLRLRHVSMSGRTARGRLDETAREGSYAWTDLRGEGDAVGKGTEGGKHVGERSQRSSTGRFGQDLQYPAAVQLHSMSFEPGCRTLLLSAATLSTIHAPHRDSPRPQAPNRPSTERRDRPSLAPGRSPFALRS